MTSTHGGFLRAYQPVLLGLLIVTVGFVAYLNSFDGVFLFDDHRHILDSPRVTQLWPPWPHLTTRRPVVSLSLAVNYAIGKTDPWGYHAFNLAVHLLAGLTLFGLVRRTLALESVRRVWKSMPPSPDGLAAVIALIWVVHPLQTQSVTYIVQRGESLMGLFYLLTMYCLLRGANSKYSRGWFAATVAACVFGMASKAVMVTAPILVLLFDRVFLATSWRDVLRRRWALYSALAFTWIVLAVVGVVGGVLSTSAKAQATVGFAFKAISPLEYAQTEFGVIVHYLKLSLWPSNLCLDYLWPVANTVVGIALPAALIALLLGATVWALLRVRPLGFVGAWFFIILAPTSSVIPILDPLFEHRMYLPLAAVIVIAVIACRGFVLALLTRMRWSPQRQSAVQVMLVGAVVVVLAVATARRNRDYHSELAMWSDVVAKRPENFRGHTYLASALKDVGRLEEAVAECTEAIRLNPVYADGYTNLGLTRLAMGDVAGAVEPLEKAVEIEPRQVIARFALGSALRDTGQLEEAVVAYREGLRYDPQNVSAHLGLGHTYVRMGRIEAGVGQYQEALRLDPTEWKALHSLGNALIRQGNPAEAIIRFRAAIRINPGYPDTHYRLGFALARLGQLDDAAEAYRSALRLNPAHQGARRELLRIQNSAGGS